MTYHIYRNVLRLVTELHVRGYQRVRIAPGMAPSGVHWRCAITPSANISRQHGARLIAWDTLTVHVYPIPQATIDRARFLAGALELEWALGGIQSQDMAVLLVHLGRARASLPMLTPWV